MDKANENAAFICQQLYALALIKQLGLDQNTTNINQTYIQITKTNNREKQFDL